MLKADQKKVADNISRNTSLTAEETMDHIKTGETISASQALKKGFIHEIKPFKMDDDSRLLLSDNINPQSDENKE